MAEIKRRRVLSLKNLTNSAFMLMFFHYYISQTGQNSRFIGVFQGDR